MKKTITLLAFVLTQSVFLNAQSVGSSTKSSGGGSSDKCINQGNIIIDAYYGFPNLYASVFKALVSQGGYTNAKVSSFGPVGGKVEYILTEKFGMGAEFNYSSIKITESLNTTDGNGNPVTYHFTFASPAFRAMVGFNFHFVNTDKIDVYGAVKTGYYSRTFSFSSDEPGYRGLTVNNYFPVAFRLETGMRYFFIPNLGVHLNIGLGGGPIIAAGLSGKF
jgi:hypothetical protein